MQNKNLILAVGVGILIVVGYLYTSSPSSYTNGDRETPINNALPVAKEENKTKSAVPIGTKVPEVGEKVSGDTAVPLSVSSAAPGSASKLRSFNISADKNSYTPSTVIVNVYDTVHISFTAVDKTYDITVPDYGLKQTAKKGETKIIEFQALNEGKYLYYCDLCGGQSSSTKGYIIISKK